MLCGSHRPAVKVLNGCRNSAGNRFSAVGKPPAVVQAYHRPFINKHHFSGWLLAVWDSIWESEAGKCRLRRGSAASRLVGLRVRIPPRAWMSLVSAVCSATGRSLLHRGPTECSVPECDQTQH